jgi:hypothetical protein
VEVFVRDIEAVQDELETNQVRKCLQTLFNEARQILLYDVLVFRKVAVSVAL